MCIETAVVHAGPDDEDEMMPLVCDLPDDYPHDLHWDERDGILWKESRP